MAPSDLIESGTTYGPPPAEGLRRLADRWADRLAHRERALWVLVVLALVVDVATTAAGLGAGHVEGNPVVAGILERAGFAGFVAFKGAILSFAVALRLALPRFRVVIPLGTALPWLAAGTVNAGLLVATL